MARRQYVGISGIHAGREPQKRAMHAAREEGQAKRQNPAILAAQTAERAVRRLTAIANASGRAAYDGITVGKLEATHADLRKALGQVNAMLRGQERLRRARKLGSKVKIGNDVRKEVMSIGQTPFQTRVSSPESAFEG